MSRKLWVFYPSPIMVSTINGLIEAEAPGLEYEVIVSPDLLDQAIAEGFTESVRSKVKEAVLAMPEGAGDLMLCTCSTIGGLAEQIGRENKRFVLRIDRPMGERAVEIGGRIGVAAALASTLTPTVDMIQSIAKEKNTPIEIETLLCAEAWEMKKTGDDNGYIKYIADYLREKAAMFDVIVLAQGSMAPAKQQLEGTKTPVLSSPELAVEAVLALLQKP